MFASQPGGGGCGGGGAKLGACSVAGELGSGHSRDLARQSRDPRDSATPWRPQVLLGRACPRGGARTRRISRTLAASAGWGGESSLGGDDQPRLCASVSAALQSPDVHTARRTRPTPAPNTCAQLCSRTLPQPRRDTACPPDAPAAGVMRRPARRPAPRGGAGVASHDRRTWNRGTRRPRATLPRRRTRGTPAHADAAGAQTGDRAAASAACCRRRTAVRACDNPVRADLSTRKLHLGGAGVGDRHCGALR